MTDIICKATVSKPTNPPGRLIKTPQLRVARSNLTPFQKTLSLFAMVTMWLPAVGYIFAAESIFESGETQTSLVEIFTSEGCSSCPPAEKWLSAFKSKPDLWKKSVPVAFHVDYWDRLGWRDRFAKPEFTLRQQQYAAQWGGDSVYTPGVVVNGREWRDWLGNALPASSKKVGTLRVTVNDDGRVSAIFVAESNHTRALTLNAALLGNELESDLKRGENTGRKLRQEFVVLSFTNTEMMHEGSRWTGSVAIPTKSGSDNATALAAWLTEAATPIQAT